MKIVSISLKLLILIGLLLLPGAAQAQTAPGGLRFEANLGFDGYAKDGEWMPVTVYAFNAGVEVTGQLRLSTGYPGEAYVKTLNLPSQAQKEVTILMPCQGGEVTLSFVSDSGKVLYESKETPRNLSNFTMLVGVISTNPALLDLLGGVQTLTYNEPLVVAHLSPQDLPEQSAALAMLDALVVNDVDTSVLNGAQVEALGQWVDDGGQLVVGGGPNAALTASGLSTLLPVVGLKTETLSTLTDLGDYAGRSIPAQGPYLAAIPQTIAGEVDLAEQGQPFLVHQQRGSGRVTYFALDFGLAPMDGWAGNEAFWKQVLNPLQASPPLYSSYQVAGALNDLLANISVNGLPSPWFLLLFLFSYGFVLVPLNYLVLKKLNRRELAWITFPALILLFSLFGYVAGSRVRGGEAILRRISVVSQTAGQPSAAVDTFMGLYSPVRERYTLKFDRETLVQPTNNNSAFNGVKTTSSAPTMLYYGPMLELQNFWTDIGSMSTAQAHERANVDQVEVNLSLVQQGHDTRVSGSIVNHGQQPIKEALVLVGNQGCVIPVLPPGETPVDAVLQLLETANYTDKDLFGVNYYPPKTNTVDLMESQARDQVIRGIFWPDDPSVVSKFGLPGPSSTAADRYSVAVVGWQEGASLAGPVEVMGHKVKRDDTALRLIIGRLKGM